MRIHRSKPSAAAALVLLAGCRTVASFTPAAADCTRRRDTRTANTCVLHSSQANNGDDDEHISIDSFDAFVRMRLGLDASCGASADASSTTTTPSTASDQNVSSSPLSPAAAQAPGTSPTVYWAGGGSLYQAYSGKILANFVGYDVGRGYVLDPGRHVRQLSRKIFWFVHPESGEIMTEFEGREVKPIRYDYQVFDYRRAGDDADVTEGADQTVGPVDANRVGTSLSPILPSVVSGPRDVPVMPVTAQTAGRDRLQFQAPVFVDIDIPNVGPYRAWEFYDYTVDTTYPEDQPPTAVWCRQGSNPPFVQDGSGVMKFVGHRVDCFEDLPEPILELLEGGGNNGEYDIFREPPVDMEEVQMLQQKQQVKR